MEISFLLIVMTLLLGMEDSKELQFFLLEIWFLSLNS